MATVTERFDSSEGDSDGIDGVSAVRRFDVVLDTSTGNDSATGRPDNLNNAIDPVSARFPLGSTHHVNALLTVVNWAQPKRVDGSGTTARWIVEVLYSGPLAGVGTILDGWIVSYDVALQTENVFKDINGKLIGGSAYDLPLVAQASDPRGEDRTAKTVDGDVRVIQFPRDKVINPRSLSRFKPLTAIQLTRTVTDLTNFQVANATTFVGKINSRQFLTGAVGQILVAPMRIQEQEGSASEGDGTGVLFAVELNFIQNNDGWQFQFVDDFFEFKGYRGIVVDDEGNAIRNRYELYESGVLQSMLKNFAGATSGALASKPARGGPGFRP